MLKHISKDGLTGSVVAMIGDDAVVFWSEVQVTPDLVQVRWNHQGFPIELTDGGKFNVKGLNATYGDLKSARVGINHFVADRKRY